MQFCKNLTIYDRECNYLAEYFYPLFFYDLEKIKKVNYQSINAREIFRDQLLSWPSFVQFTNVTRLFSNLLGSFSRATKLWFLSKRANSLKAKNWEHMHWTEVKVCTIHGISNLNSTNPFPIPYTIARFVTSVSDKKTNKGELTSLATSKQTN